ncbi:MAG: PQQ-binding-like beta-propeller repeat protein [Planctomycetota bacterium]
MSPQANHIPGRLIVITLMLSFTSLAVGHLPAAEAWNQFRGANSSGQAVGSESLPTNIGPQTNVIWKTPLPPGHSSPVITDDRIYLTAVRDERLVTIALDRVTGKIIWETVAPHARLEQIHRIGSHAQASPASDGQMVVSFFGSAGLFAYDRDGQLLWQQKMGPFNNDFGAASSPIIVDDLVILCQDHDTDSFLLALDKRTGETRWRTDRSEFLRNFCTPVVWEFSGRKHLVIAATLRVVGYDLATGQERFTIRGISRTVCMTPVVGDKNRLFVAGWAAGGDADSPIRLPVFNEVIMAHDANKDRLLSEAELPTGDIKQRYSQIDRDNDNQIDEKEYEFFRSLFEQGRNLVMAIDPGAAGDSTGTHIAWTSNRFVPFCASPVFHHGFLFTVKDGGIASLLDAETGKMLKTGRLPNTGEYYSSPVAGDGKIYCCNQAGQLSVITAESAWKPLHTADFEEEIYATPALVNGRVFLRTAGHLYCFGERR